MFAYLSIAKYSSTGPIFKKEVMHLPDTLAIKVS